MKLYIAADHGGFALKNNLVATLPKEYEVVDLGPMHHDPDDDYPDYAVKVAQAVASDESHESRGVLICRSGNGMCIAANKVKGAYAALCFSKQHATKAREDDNANIVCLDAEYEGEDPLEIVKAFLCAEFAGMDTRHGRRFAKIVEIEDQQ